MKIDDIGLFFDYNLYRVKNLIDVYVEILNLEGEGTSMQKTDILRAAIVLLHSSMEDFLRSILKLKLPEASEEKLNKIPLFLNSESFHKKTKFELGELSYHRGRTVTEIIELSVYQYLDRQSYNNTGEISAALKSIELKLTSEIKEEFSKLDEMIKRRHNIVHQADREKAAGQDAYKIKTVNLEEVIEWTNAVDNFVLELAKQL